MSENYEHTFKRGDTGEPVRAIIKQDSDGNPPDWSAATVKFIIYEINDETGVMTVVVDRVSVVEPPAGSSGTLLYTPGVGDLDRVGRFPALFKVTNGTVIEHYPREGFMWLTIEDIP